MNKSIIKTNPLVSCIVTCYQKVSYLYDAIDSVLIQSYPRIQLIVADDGTDEFPAAQIYDYIERKKRDNIIESVIIHQNENIGTVRNIRSAIDRAAGKYCINLDGDDVFDHETVIDEMIGYMLSNDLDLLECSKMWCDEHLNEIELLPTREERKKIQKLNTAEKQFHSFAVLRFLNIGGGSGMGYLRENYENNGLFSNEYRNWQDGPSLTAYVQKGKKIPTNYDIVAIKYRAGGVSNKPESNTISKTHIGEDHIKYIESVTMTDKRNPYIFRRRRFLYYYLMEKTKGKSDKLVLQFRFPFMGMRMLRKRLARGRRT